MHNCSLEKVNELIIFLLFDLGIDRLERLKGIPLKLTAIEQFMEENPKWLGKIVFVIIGISAKERADDYRNTLSDVLILTQRINEKFGSEVVYFEEREDRAMPLRRRLAFFAASHVLMITAPRCVFRYDMI